MAKSFGDSFDWYWVFIILVIIVIGVGSRLDKLDDNRLIEACIRSGRNPVVERGSLKECK